MAATLVKKWHMNPAGKNYEIKNIFKLVKKILKSIMIDYNTEAKHSSVSGS